MSLRCERPVWLYRCRARPRGFIRYQSIAARGAAPHSCSWQISYSLFSGRGADMNNDDRQLRYTSKPTIDWHSLFSWAVIIAGFSVATFLFLL